MSEAGQHTSGWMDVPDAEPAGGDELNHASIAGTASRMSLGRAGRAAAMVPLLGLLILLAWGLGRVGGGPLGEGPAPDFTLTTFAGEDVTLSELRGSVVIINFWASWCPPCREEADYLEATWRRYRDSGVVLIGVDYLDTEKEALAYIAEFDITYPNGPDLGSRISREYRIQGVPETFFVDTKGQLRGFHIGPVAPPQLEEKIEQLLAEAEIQVKSY